MDYDTLKEIAKHNICADCKSDFTIAWKDGKYQLRCGCGYHEEPGALERVPGMYERLKTGEPIEHTIKLRMLNKLRIEREMRELKEQLRKEGTGK